MEQKKKKIKKKAHGKLLDFAFLGPLHLHLPSSLSLLGCFEDGVVSQDLAELVEAVLHLGDAGELGLQPLLLLGEGEAGRRVQLLETPAALAVELQQVSVVLPEMESDGWG